MSDKTSEKRVRTRFAPSPTGFMHLGVLRTALYAYLIAKQRNGDFLLRIEDTDTKRYVEGAVDVIYSTLLSCGLNWDEGPDIGGKYGPYVQSRRLAIYSGYAHDLVKKHKAYYCFCTEERLAELHEQQKAEGKVPCYDRHCRDMSPYEIRERLENNESYVIRQMIPFEGTTTFHDEVRGDITVPNADMDDQILLKSDGYPTYNFANVIDDHLMEITHIVRGVEFLSGTPKYTLLYEAFGWEAPKYIHVEQIMRDSHHKLSKRHGDAYFSDFIDKGYLIPAILNYIALLGWSPGGENEIFSLDELTEVFDISGLSRSPAIFDEAKLKAINGIYMRLLSLREFRSYAEPVIRSVSRVADAECVDFDVLCKSLQPRTELLTDIPPQVDFLDGVNEYSAELYVNKKMKTTKESSLNALKHAAAALEYLDIKEFTLGNLHVCLAKVIEDMGVKNGHVLWPVRLALSGKESTPGGGAELCAVLGKAVSLRRLYAAIDKLEAAISAENIPN
jgi:glutamyl-tRNA synthetase